MSAKNYLMQLIYIDRRIDSKLEQLVRLRSAAIKINTIISDMPRSDSPNRQAMADSVVKIVDLEVEINHDIDKLVDMKAAARIAINDLSDPEQQLILEMRYLHCMAWPEIVEELNSSETSIHRLHGQALKELVLPEKWE